MQVLGKTFKSKCKSWARRSSLKASLGQDVQVLIQILAKTRQILIQVLTKTWQVLIQFLVLPSICAE